MTAPTRCSRWRTANSIDTESAQSMQRALRLDRSALSHTQAVVAAAYSLEAIGHGPAALDLLKKHLTVQPTVSKDRDYSQAVSRIESAGQRKTNWARTRR